MDTKTHKILPKSIGIEPNFQIGLVIRLETDLDEIIIFTSTKE